MGDEVRRLPRPTGHLTAARPARSIPHSGGLEPDLRGDHGSGAQAFELAGTAILVLGTLTSF
jgi:hypothetical protein